MTNPLRALRLHVEQLADRLHADADAQALARGWSVQRLPWGTRRYSHPAVTAVLAERAATYEQARKLRVGPHRRPTAPIRALRVAA